MDGVTTSRIQLLDGFTVTLDDPATTVEDLPRAVQRLVAHLCLTGRPARAAIAGQLWPDVPEDHAQGSLRTALWRLQKVAPGMVTVSGGALRLAPGIRTDVQELTEWSRRVVDPRTSPAELDLPAPGMHGELLPGWYDDWVLLERERLRQERVHALEVLAGRLAEGARFAEALQAAFAAVRAGPLRESAHRTVVQVHLAEGNLAEAVRAYEAFGALVADELGVGPTAQMTRLLDGLPRPRPSSDPSAGAGQPNVKTSASAPGARNSISN